MDLPAVEILCPRCRGKGKIINPNAHDIHWIVEWLCGVQDAVRKERELYHYPLTKYQTVAEGYDWLMPEEEERWLWATSNRYYVG